MASKRAPTGGRHRKRPDPQALAVGKRVRALRKERDFSFDEFVAETELGRGYISELERGLVAPGIHALARLAKTLDVAVADLVLADTPRERLFDLTRDLPDADVEDLIADVERSRAELGLK